MSALDTILGKSQAKEDKHGGYIGHCPCPSHNHGDRNPSLAIKEVDGTIFLFCRASHHNGAQLAEYFDLTPADLFSSDKPKPKHNGYTLQQLAEHVKLPADYLMTLGLHNGRKGRFSGVLVPFYAPDGTEVSVSVRTGPTGHDMRREPDKKMIPYGRDLLEVARKQKALLIVEGESDCWACWYHNIPALGIAGTSLIDSLMLSDMTGINTVYISNERDAAALDFIPNLHDRLDTIGYKGTIKVLTMPDDIKDPHALYTDNPEQFRERMEHAIKGALLIEDYIDTSTDERTINLADVKEEDIDWLWYSRVAFGKITLLDGDPDIGKSIVFGAEIPARITKGRGFPNDVARHIQGNVMIIAPEDGLEDTYKPRFLRAGGIEEDCIVWRELYLPSEISRLERTIRRRKIRYLYIDSIMSCLDPGIKTGDDASVRKALNALMFMVERTHVACVMTRHFKKGNEQKAIHQGGGSIAFTAVSRINLAIGRDPDNKEKKVITILKCNPVPESRRESLTYTILNDGRNADGTDKPPYIKWLGVSTLRAEDVIHAASSDERREILDVLENAYEPMTPKKIAEELGQPVNNINQLLRKMVKREQVVSLGKGKYAARVNAPEPEDNEQQEVILPDQSDQSDQNPLYTRDSIYGNSDHNNNNDQNNRAFGDDSDRSDRSDPDLDELKMHREVTILMGEMSASSDAKAPDVAHMSAPPHTLPPLMDYVDTGPMPMSGTICKTCGQEQWIRTKDIPGKLLCARCYPPKTWAQLATMQKMGA